jgi:Domain of unknown function (DUF2383)
MAKPEEKLNSLLQGELSAVETYNMALDKIKTPTTTAVLTECRSCHADRAAKLTEAVRSMGGEPATSSGPWGSFAKLVEAGAVILGEGSTVGAIKEGEDQGLETYQAACKHTEDASGAFVSTNLLSAQERTQKAIADLAKNMPKN